MFATIWMCTHEWSLISRRATAFTFATCHHAFSSVSVSTRDQRPELPVAAGGDVDFRPRDRPAGVRRTSRSASSETGCSIRSSVSGSSFHCELTLCHRRFRLRVRQRGQRAVHQGPGQADVRRGDDVCGGEQRVRRGTGAPWARSARRGRARPRPPARSRRPPGGATVLTPHELGASPQRSERTGALDDDDWPGDAPADDQDETDHEWERDGQRDREHDHGDQEPRRRGATRRIVVRSHGRSGLVPRSARPAATTPASAM